MAELINRRYALSLLEAGLDLEKLEVFHNELKFVEETFLGEEKLLEISAL